MNPPNLEFKPSGSWQPVPDWAVLPNGGEYYMNGTTGAKFVRWNPPVPPPEAVIDRRTGEPQVIPAKEESQAPPVQPKPALQSAEPKPNLNPAYVETVDSEDEEQYAHGSAPLLDESRVSARGENGEIGEIVWGSSLGAVSQGMGSGENAKPSGENSPSPTNKSSDVGENSPFQGVKIGDATARESSLGADPQRKFAISPNSPCADTQEAPFPADSILADYVSLARKITEGADCYIIGSILPVVAALLGRAVWFPWCGKRLYPNLFSMVVGKPGDRKSSTIDLAEIIARSSLPKEAFLPLAFSPETLFDEYDQDVGGRTDKLWFVDDANPILSDWQNDTNGERNAARFLRLYDCKDLSESYRRNREKNNPQSQRRLIPETSTSLVFGATFNLCMFRRQATRAGLQRRFLYYVAEKLARQILHPPQLDKEFAEVAQAFKELSQLSGKFTFSDQAKALFETFQRNNRLQSDQADPLDEALCSRIASAPAQTLKVAMNFEASRAVYNGSGSLQLQANTIQLAIAHVETCHLAAQALEAISRRAVIANEAELLLERIRADFRSKAKNGAIILTRSELTRAYASHGHRDNRVEELYRHLIPRLIQIGDAKALPKNGKLERYAFRVEGK